MAIVPRWSMVLSHHPPSQYDRTWQLLNVRVCVRCSGVVVGIALGAAAITQLDPRPLPTAAVVALLAVVVTAGVAAFVLNETGARRSNNVERVAFGVAVGACFPLAWQAGYGYFAGMIGVLIVAQFTSAALLRRAGVLDRFVTEYLDGAQVDDSAEPSSPPHCSRASCTCGAAHEPHRH